MDSRPFVRLRRTLVLFHTYSLRCELGIGEAGGNIGKRRADGRRKFSTFCFAAEWTPCFWSTPWRIPRWQKERRNQIHLDLMTRMEKKSLKWFYGWKKYPHRLVLNVPKSDDEDVLRVNRLVCYFDKAERIDFKKLVVKNIDKNIFHLVSFENECIFSVYDDRGCDIVFADKEKYAGIF